MTFLIIVSLAAAFASAANVVRNHYSESLFKLLGSYFDPAESKQRIYRYGDPSKGERFYGSSDLFCVFWDGEKLLTFISLQWLAMSVIFYRVLTPYAWLDYFLIFLVTFCSYRFTKWFLTLFNVR